MSIDTNRIELNRVDHVDEAVRLKVHDLFQFHVWDDTMINSGSIVRSALEDAYNAVLHNVPPSPTRTRALNNIIDARMLANAAITHKGKY